MSRATLFIPPSPARAADLRKAYLAGDPSVTPVVERLVTESAELLAMRPPSVMDKAGTPPSGDKHDYMSLGTYWWPDPNTADGLPYIRRDGERNPETNSWDITSIGDAGYGAVTLSLAYGVTGREEFAAKAAAFLRTWFLDEATRMNPHLEFGQAIPGRVTGRGIGIIDTRYLCGIWGSAKFLECSDAWTGEDRDKLRKWLGDYLEWLLTSAHGIDEAGQHNNHGMWYDVQVVSFALNTGNETVARDVLGKLAERRIFSQVAADGAQPHELARTLSVNYATMNLNGMTLLAEAGKQLGMDIWGASGPEGQGIKRALEWTLPYAHNPAAWPSRQIKTPDWTNLAYPLFLGARAYEEPRFAEAARAALGDQAMTDRVNLYI